MNDGLHVTAGPDEDGMTARGVLVRAKGVSQRLIRTIKHGEGHGAGALFINGLPARFKDRVRAGDEISLVFPSDQSHFEPQDIALSVLYEDDDLLAVNKQPGIVVHPTRGHREGTLANAVTYYMQARGEKYAPRFVSRLDMNTSGVLLVGKNSHVQDSLAKQSKAGATKKMYTVVLEGCFEGRLPAAGLIDLPIGLPDLEDPRRAVMPVEDGGYPSQSAYEVFWEDKGLGITFAGVRLLTGRTHQIRVHFAHFGFPVLGDELYGGPSTLIARQALHASGFCFEHPRDGRPMKIEAPLPEDMAGVVSLRNGGA